MAILFFVPRLVFGVAYSARPRLLTGCGAKYSKKAVFVSTPGGYAETGHVHSRFKIRFSFLLLTFNMRLSRRENRGSFFDRRAN
jgi:hypothetical protein